MKPISEILEEITSSLTLENTAANARYAKWLEEDGERVRKTYGELSDDQVLDIIEAEKMQQECEECIKEKHQNCPRVSELAYFIAPDGTVTQEKCAKKQREELEYFSELAKIPKIYRYLTFEDYSTSISAKRALKQAQEAIKEHKGLLIRGSIGSGKTMLASIIATDLIKQGKRLLFTTLNDIIIELEARSPAERPEFIANLSTIRYLVIDDLGTEPATAQIEALLFQLINNRYNNNNPVIVTTNLKVDFDTPNLSRKRIFSRLLGTCKTIILEGQDLRLGINSHDQG